MAATQDLYFVYLGASLPKYALPAIELASRYSGLNVTLIGNEGILTKREKQQVNFVATESFYDSDEFLEASRRLSFDHFFRDSFWLKTLERFFVLEQFMSHENLKSILHAELDQLFFRTDLLLEKLTTIGKSGLFFPLHDLNAGVASIFFCNDQESLRSLLKFAGTGNMFPNEMALLANWARKNPSSVNFLPTLASKTNYNHYPIDIARSLLSVDQLGGVVDAAQIGWWVGGLDPRNVPANQKPSSKYEDSSGELMLSQNQLLKLNFNLTSLGTLEVELDKSEKIIVFNLHLHSKIHKHLLKADSSFSDFFKYANSLQPHSFPGTRGTQLVFRIQQRLIFHRDNPSILLARLKAKWNLKFKRRPSSNPFLSGDTFRAMSEHIWDQDNQDLDPDVIESGEIIFCESDFLESLQEEVLDVINVPIILILGNSDKNHSSELAAIAASQNVSAIYAQNLITAVPKTYPLPIGLENAWRANYGRISTFRRFRSRNSPRDYLVMWAFTISTNTTERTRSANSLINCSVAVKLDRLTPRNHQRALKRFAFVASPPGNGFDAHRTWEAMYLGCVPIVLRSFMNESFEKMGLPIWVVDSFDELNAYSSDELKQKYEEFIPKFESDALWIDSWRRDIDSHSTPIE